MTDSPIDSPLLDMEGMIGFCGTVTNGFRVHPNRQHVIYPVGCTIVIEDMNTKKQEFLTGHTNNVSCLAVSKSGRYLASGQITHMGFKADVYIWDFEKRTQHCKLTLHRVKVEALAFSPNDKYLVSLGGGDDGSVVVWNIATKEAICGSPAQVMSAGKARTVAYSNNDDNIFVTGGEGTLRVWKLDLPNRKIWPSEVKLGKIKRTVTCIEFEDDDSFFYFGTVTGDVFAINMSTNIFQVKGPKENFSKGVTALCKLKTGDFLVGAGDGSITIVKGRDAEFKRTKKSAKLKGSVTSITLRGQGHQFYVGTETGNIYRFNYAEFTHELVSTCHYSAVNDVAFPYGCANLFSTCSLENIRVWNSATNQELLRIHVPNFECNALEITRDGKSIISGWSDGKIRTFMPESGKEMFTQGEAHAKGVTALASYSDCRHIVSGGGEGSVRVWQIGSGMTQKGLTYTTRLLFTLKEHQNTVTCIKVRKNDKECVTSSFDGSCVVWDLTKQCRVQMIRSNTLFNFVCYHPDEHQILTTGTDRKIGYWEAFDGSMIRELDGSSGGSINTMDISADGKYFVSGGDDRLIKVWDYQGGEVTHMGIGHSAPVKRVKISPDERFIISVSADGAILRWRFPHCS